MTLTLPNDLSAQIEREARQRGTDPRAFVIEATRRALDPDAALDSLLDTLLDNRAANGLPPLSEEQVSRAAFYEDEDEA